MRLPGGEWPEHLAERLRSIGYTVEGVRDHLGHVAADALDREEDRPAKALLLGEDDALSVALRLLLLGEWVDGSAAGRALDVDPSALGDLVAVHDAQLQATVELAPYATDDHDWFVASDWSTRRTGRPAAPDHVLGVGGASTMLAQCTVRPEVGTALDLGTGCGVQALHLAGHTQHVVGTDISRRAMELAAFNARLNDVRLDLRRGSLFEPVADERFDLIVSNPPFVIGSPDGARHDYRDSGLPGDAVCAHLVRGVSAHLMDGGWCQLLANWEITEGDDWAAGPREWLGSAELDSWVIQRDVQDPAQYVETWLQDAGEQWSPRYGELYDAWLSGLAARGVLGIGFGLVTVHRSGRAAPVRRFQHAPQPWQQPVATDVERWFAAQDLLADGPGQVLLAPLHLSADVVVEGRRRLGEQADTLTVVRTSGMGWSGVLDAFGLEVLEELDGVRSAGESVVDVAARHGVDPGEALSAAIPVLVRLVEEGFLLPAAQPG